MGRVPILAIELLKRVKRDFSNALMWRVVGVTVFSYPLAEPAKAASQVQKGHFRSMCDTGTYAEACSSLFCTRRTNAAVTLSVSDLCKV